jgi:hypothetical protein
MDYFKVALSGLTAILVANFACIWPLLRNSKATGLAAVGGLCVENLFSLKFWIIGGLLFGVLYAASRSGAVPRALFFWVPTLAVSVIGFTFLAAVTYLSARR